MKAFIVLHFKGRLLDMPVDTRLGCKWLPGQAYNNVALITNVKSFIAMRRLFLILNTQDK